MEEHCWHYETREGPVWIEKHRTCCHCGLRQTWGYYERAIDHGPYFMVRQDGWPPSQKECKRTPPQTDNTLTPGV